jgi:hypothetical protein
MQFKPVPEEPEEFTEVETVWQALPREVGPDIDCCECLLSSVDWIDARDEAADWLVFLRALGVVEVVDQGYVRTDTELHRAVLAERFLDSVLAAEAVVDALGAEPLSAECVRRRVQESDDHRFTSGETVLQERVQRLLRWAVLFDLARRSVDGYARA